MYLTPIYRSAQQPTACQDRVYALSHVQPGQAEGAKMVQKAGGKLQTLRYTSGHLRHSAQPGEVRGGTLNTAAGL